MSLSQDIQYALRSMRKSPRVTLTVLATLALGIGANTAIFSVVNAALLEPLPFQHPGELVSLNADLRGLGARNVGFSVPEFEDLRDRAGVFSQVSVVWQCPVNLTGGDHPERLQFLAVSPNYFNILGAQAQLGRLFDASDIRDGFSESAVISDALWHRDFGGDRAILGRRVRLDNDLYTIVGVMPAQFQPPMPAGLEPVDAWMTTGFRASPFPSTPRRGARFLPGLLARLRPGVTLKLAQAQLAVFSNSLRRDYGSDYPASAGWTMSIEPLKDEVAGGARTLLISLLMAVGLILLIACVNVANLLLVNASARQPEFALRMALGATRGRIIGQLLTEAALLSLVSAIAGAGAAFVGLRILVAALPSQLPRLNPIGIDGRVLAFSLTVAMATTVLFGLIPALKAARTEPGTSDLRQRAGTTSRRDGRLRKTLIGAEVALSLMLLVAAGLLLRTFWNLLEVNPGFNASHLLAGNIWISVPNEPELDTYRKPAQRTVMLREVERRLRTIPGVEDAALSGVVPLQGPTNPDGFHVEGAPAQGDVQSAVQISVSPDFIQTMGTSLIGGRAIVDTDDTNSPLVVMVDEAAARQFWGNQNPVGRRIQFSQFVDDAGKPALAPWMTVVGVVRNAKFTSLDEQDAPHVYSSIYQFSGREIGLLIRATGDKATLTRAVTRETQTVDPNLPVSNMTEMSALIRNGVGDRRFAAWLIAAFALVALLLTSVGVYGVASYAIVRRAKEIGIRSALGAGKGQLVGMILREGMVPVLAGLALGGIAAVLSGRLMATMLFNVPASDAIVLASAGATLAAVGVLSNYLPARRAASIEPMTALRND